MVKLIFSFNTLPKINDYSYGFERRLTIINFEKTYICKEDYEKRAVEGKELRGIGIADLNLEKELEQEMSDIVSLLINRLRELSVRDFKIEEPESMKQQREDYVRRNNEILEFFEEVFKVDRFGKSKILKSNVYITYKEWMKENHYGEEGLSSKKFWERIRNIMTQKGMSLENFIVKINGYEYLKGFEVLATAGIAEKIKDIKPSRIS